MKNTPRSPVGLQARTQQKSMCDISHEDGSGPSCYDVCGSLGANLIEDITRGIDMQKFSSNMCDLSIDPFWPLCMFELRGKCNNEKCQWQHVKDLAENVKQHDDSARAGMAFNLISTS